MKIERKLMPKLVEWKQFARRKPLILQGMRQCGKTWLLREFGRESFDNTVYLNFEQENGVREFFAESLKPHQILQHLAVYSGESIQPNETLIIFDEIQECPAALTSLKYFCEEAPEYAIAAAGSLLGVMMHSGKGFPVGKTDFLELGPCSFDEYLAAADPALANYLTTIPLQPVLAPYLQKLELQLREYMTLGGLPGVLNTFLETQDLSAADAELEKLLLSYEADFGKHASARDVPKLFLLWHSIPEQFAKENRHFIYGEVRQGARAKDLEDALQWLIQAHLIRMVSLVETPEMPLEAVRSRKIFKLYPTDVGILRKLAKLPLSILLQGGDLFDSFKGKLAETYVLEQLLAQRFDPVCYWANSRGTAEVDFLIQGDSGILPVEVKSGLNLKSKSLKVYRSLFSPPLSVRTSLQNLRQDDGLLNIPLPLLGHLSRFLQR